MTAAPGDRSWIAGGVVLAVLLLGLSWITVGTDPEATRIAVRLAGAVLAIVVAIASQWYWRATGHAAGYLVATAGWLLAVAKLAELGAPERWPDSVSVSAVPIVLAAVWVGRAVIGPEVDTTSGPAREALRAAVALAIGWRTTLAVASYLAIEPGPVEAIADLLPALAWGVVAIIGLGRAINGTTVLRSWVAWMASALTFASFAHHLSAVQASAWLPASATLSLGALLVGAIGAVGGLSRSALAWRDEVYAVSVRHGEVARDRDEVQRELRHEIRTALLAIEGATLALDQDPDGLDDQHRARLTAAVRSGIHHLRGLVGDVPCVTPERRVRSLVEERAILATGRGIVRAEVEGDPALRATVEAGPLVQVVDNLLCNAERHAALDGQARVRIVLRADGRTLRMLVSDDGPGIPESEHARVFEPHHRLVPDRAGDGLGLSVARRLVRELGGDLSLRPSPTGACFELALPLRPLAGESTDVREDGRQVREVLDHPAARVAHLTAAPSRRPVIEFHGQLGGRLRRSRCDDRHVEDLAG